MCFRHAEWRKVAKKLRRKRIRSAIASQRNEVLQKGTNLEY